MGSLKTEEKGEHDVNVSNEAIVYVNGVRRVLADGLAHLTLLEYLRGIVFRFFFFFNFRCRPCNWSSNWIFETAG